MQLRTNNLEILKCVKRGDYYDVQVALNGTLAPSMEIHAEAREQYPTEQAWIDYLTRCARSLIDIYGDARYPRHLSVPDVEAHALAAPVR
jgi:hypothetical protein